MAEAQLRPYQDRLDTCPSRVARHDWWLRLTTTDPRLHVGVGRIITRRGLTAGFLSLFKGDVIMQQGLVLLALGIVLGICPQISQAGFVTFVATLGPEVSGATGTGFAQVDLDTVAHLMRVQVNFRA